jgi:archaellum component FlaG (FlaF/FlaG flagellin family)
MKSSATLSFLIKHSSHKEVTMNIQYSIRTLGVLGMAIVLLIVTFRSVNAESISYCDAFPDIASADCRAGPLLSTNWNGQLSVPQFDPVLGSLIGVRITLEGSLRGDVQYENTGPNSTIISATHGVTIEVEFPNANLVSTAPTATQVDLVAPFDGNSDFIGPSGRTFTISTTKAISIFLDTPADIAFFIGGANINFPAQAQGISFIRGPGNLDALLQAQAASLILVVTYIFERPGIEIKKYTNDQDADDPNDADVPQVAIGQPVVWTYLVKNTGDIPFALAEITVTDDQPGVTPERDATTDSGGDNILSPGETWTYRATLPAQDLRNVSAGITIVDGCDPTSTGITRPTYENIGAVQATTLNDSDPSHYCNPPAPGIDIKKFTNGRDADGPNDDDVPEIAPNATVTWTYLVTNTGNVSYTLNQVAVTDSQPGLTLSLFDQGDGDDFLEPGEVWRYRATQPAQNLLTPTSNTRVVPGCNPHNSGLPRATYENIGTVRVDDLTDFDPSHYCNPPTPGIDIEKLVNGNDADNPNGNDVPPITPGQTVNWLYRVRNTGNISFTLANVTVTDSQSAIIPTLDPLSDSGGDQILAPGETWLYRASVQAQNLRTPTLGTTVVQGCNPSATTAPGERATYRNIGSATVPGASDSDPAHYCNPPAPGINIKKLTNDHDANDPNGADVPQIAPGAAVVWTYLVTNTGNIAFTRAEVVVIDSHSGVIPMLDLTSDNGDQILSPGESWRYRASGVADNLQSPSPATVVVSGCNPAGTTDPGERATYRNIGRVVVPGSSDSDSSHYCNPLTPGITIKKYTNGQDADGANDPDVPLLVPGTPVTWTYYITNTGDIPFARDQITVTDDQPGVTPVFLPISDDGSDNILSPDESWIYIAVRTTLNLTTTAEAVTIVEGCATHGNGETRPTYENIGAVVAGPVSDNDPSHYCNRPPTSLDEKPEPQRPARAYVIFLPFVRE